MINNYVLDRVGQSHCPACGKKTRHKFGEMVGSGAKIKLCLYCGSLDVPEERGCGSSSCGVVKSD
jgi:phage/plasmid primase-like uncharacterized protein